MQMVGLQHFATEHLRLPRNVQRFRIGYQRQASKPASFCWSGNEPFLAHADGRRYFL